MVQTVRFTEGPTAPRIVQPAIFSVWVLVEISRLRLGYSGNLDERIPELSAFLMLTIFPALPFVAVLTFLDEGWKLPIDEVPGWFQLAFYIAEVLMAPSVVRGLMRAQTAQYFRQVEMQNQANTLHRDVPQLGDRGLEDNNEFTSSSIVRQGMYGIQREASAIQNAISGRAAQKDKES